MYTCIDVHVHVIPHSCTITVFVHETHCDSTHYASHMIHMKSNITYMIHIKTNIPYMIHMKTNMEEERQTQFSIQCSS